MSDMMGGAMLPLNQDIRELERGETDLRRFERQAVTDRFSIDLDRGMVLLGPVARQHHGISGGSGMIGIGRFLDCYDAGERATLLRLIEELASDARPFYYTARLAGSAGSYVHGYIARSSGGGEAAGEWSGVMVISPSGLTAPVCFDAARVN